MPNCRATMVAKYVWERLLCVLGWKRRCGQPRSVPSSSGQMLAGNHAQVRLTTPDCVWLRWIASNHERKFVRPQLHAPGALTERGVSPLQNPPQLPTLLGALARMLLCLLLLFASTATFCSVLGWSLCFLSVLALVLAFKGLYRCL